jgi:hypothetical protein
MRTWHSPDGINWGVDVELPGSSNAMVTFRHPSGASSRLDRYNWFISHGPEARSVTSHLSKDTVMELLLVIAGVAGARLLVTVPWSGV